MDLLGRPLALELAVRFPGETRLAIRRLRALMIHTGLNEGRTSHGGDEMHPGIYRQSAGKRALRHEQSPVSPDWGFFGSQESGMVERSGMVRNKGLKSGRGGYPEGDSRPWCRSCRVASDSADRRTTAWRSNTIIQSTPNWYYADSVRVFRRKGIAWVLAF